MVTTSALDSLEITRWELGDLEFFYPYLLPLRKLSTMRRKRTYQLRPWLPHLYVVLEGGKFNVADPPISAVFELCAGSPAAVKLHIEKMGMSSPEDSTRCM
jgi:hypothetical protein